MKQKARHSKPAGSGEETPVGKTSLARTARPTGFGSFDVDLHERAFSRQVKVSEIPEHGLELQISASARECMALAEDFGLVGVAKLEAAFLIGKRSGGGFNAKGTLNALVSETCVISLEPFQSAIEAEIDLDFIDEAKLLPDRRQAVEVKAGPLLGAVLAEESDPPEPIINGKIDLGAIAAEFLALNLNPYPKKPGVQFEDLTLADPEPEKISPFDILRKLKERE